MEDGKFKDVSLNELKIYDVQKGRDYLILLTTDGKYILKQRALTQFLKFLGMKKTQFARMTRNEFEYYLIDAFNAVKDKLMFGVLEIEPNVFYVFRVTTNEFTPIPHKVLFDFVRGVLKDVGFNVEPEVKRYSVRTVAYYYLFKKDLKYARRGDAISIALGVSNANTGHHSIKVFGYFEILMCKNGLTHPEFTSRIRVYHVKDASQILKRVGEAVKEVVAKLTKASDVVKSKVETLEDIKIEEPLIEMWLSKIEQQLPKKYRRWFYRVFMENREIFGDTALTMFQTLTYFVPRLASANEELSQRLNKHAVRLLEEPKAYIETVIRH